jgi:hypothetical protein
MNKIYVDKDLTVQLSNETKLKIENDRKEFQNSVLGNTNNNGPSFSEKRTGFDMPSFLIGMLIAGTLSYAYILSSRQSK